MRWPSWFRLLSAGLLFLSPALTGAHCSEDCSKLPSHEAREVPIEGASFDSEAALLRAPYSVHTVDDRAWLRVEASVPTAIVLVRADQPLEVLALVRAHHELDAHRGWLLGGFVVGVVRTRGEVVLPVTEDTLRLLWAYGDAALLFVPLEKPQGPWQASALLHTRVAQSYRNDKLHGPCVRAPGPPTDETKPAWRPVTLSAAAN